MPLALTNRQLITLALITLFGFGAIGLAILYFGQQVTPMQFFMAGKTIWWKQLLYGAYFALLSAIVASWIVRADFFSEEMQFFSALIKKIAPTYFHALLLSACAGIGEEILFRGGIQPYLGIWPTSIIFIILHGYINPFNIALTLYGVFMIFVSAGIGYLFEIHGIFAAIAAHFLFDLIMFIVLQKSSPAPPDSPT